ncbi:MAG: alpha-hydroxy acid oxidase [Armatimonadota bacterium]
MPDGDRLPINLDEYEAAARAHLPRMAFDYYAGGAEDESTLADNREAWRRLRLRPRVLVDVSTIDAATHVLGTPIAFPVLCAPCAFHKFAHPDGELAVVRAAARMGTIPVISTTSTYPLEEIARCVDSPKWFQLYHYRDPAIAHDLIRRAEQAGYAALCLTIDTPLLGRRERDQRNVFKLPEGIRFANMDPYAIDWYASPEQDTELARYATAQTDPSLTWNVVETLRKVTKLPIVVKGVVTAEDGRRAVEHGVDAVIVSNHGGRQLDGTVATADALPEVVDAVSGRAEVLVDGGIRRGTDVLRALALGARAVLVGRPYLWGLAVGGEDGVARVLDLLRAEIVHAMTLSGRPRLADIGPDLLFRGGNIR